MTAKRTSSLPETANDSNEEGEAGGKGLGKKSDGLKCLGYFEGLYI